jgi:hypothetical protein
MLITGNSAQSSIVMALRGMPGSPLDPNTGAFGQMPADGAFLIERAACAVRGIDRRGMSGPSA